MKSPLCALALLPLLLAACDHSQSEMLRLREEFQRQADAKDKTIEELTRKLGELSSQVSKPAVDVDALADQVAKKVAAETTPRLDEMKKRLDDLGQSRMASVEPSAPGRSAPPPAPGEARPAPAAREATPSDPNRKKYRFDF